MSINGSTVPFCIIYVTCDIHCYVFGHELHNKVNISIERDTQY